MIFCPHCQVYECEQHFYQLLAWEHDYNLQEVHHMLVLSYYLQHPDRYSPQGLSQAVGMLIEFIETDLSPALMRERIRYRVASDQRQHAITARPDSQGAYQHPVNWSMTVADVTNAGVIHFYPNVRRWAELIVQDLRASDNL